MASGKTYCADYLESQYGYHKFTLASKLKSICYELYGIQSKDGDGRRMYQEVGDALRSFDNDVFTKYTLSSINQRYSTEKVVIDDLRLPAEATLLKEAGFILVGINTPFDVRQERIDRLYPSVPQGRQSHATEVSWEAIPMDTSVNSSGPADLTDLDDLMAFYDTD